MSRKISGVWSFYVRGRVQWGTGSGTSCCNSVYDSEYCSICGNYSSLALLTYCYCARDSRQCRHRQIDCELLTVLLLTVRYSLPAYVHCVATCITTCFIIYKEVIELSVIDCRVLNKRRLGNLGISLSTVSY